jgi:SAM-dependent methyltransferase
MNLVEEYRRQKAWRAWPRILDQLPLLEGETVLDLGCGVGDVAAELVARGARVIGLDLNDELLESARARGLRGADFRSCDVRDLGGLGVVADGIWSSFGAAYFADLTPVLAAWSRTLRPGGWICLTEIDDLFAHEPLDDRTRELLEGYVRVAASTGRYDFRMGRKLTGHLERAGFDVVNEGTVPDCELAFDGPASEDVLDGWRRRFERMSLLRSHCADEFPHVREAFLAALSREDHTSSAQVVYRIATRSASRASGSSGASRTAS